MKRMAVTGFVVWLVATVSLRFAGQYVFRGGSAILLLMVTLPAMITLAIVVLRRYACATSAPSPRSHSSRQE